MLFLTLQIFSLSRDSNSKRLCETGTVLSLFDFASPSTSIWMVQAIRFGIGNMSSAMLGTQSKHVQNVLIIEDQHLMRTILVDELKGALTTCFVQGAANMSQAMDMLETNLFDLVIIDPGLPGFDPRSQSDRLAVVQTIIEMSPNAIHFVITGSDSDEEWRAMQKLGVSAYLAKNHIRPGSMIEVLDDFANEGLSVRFADEAMAPPEFVYSGLTPREQELINWMRQRPEGKSRRQIYEELGHRIGIDPDSAEKYYKRARAKLLKTGILPKGL
ncbi:response regulator [Phyllobacterium sp. 0TCS1.6C]|uniref:response regulator transcription factor n=1 Tax=unclassified Phyllobacterium TaxID=2638441 RepID=UPI0022644B16|nr:MULTISPECIES: response regulator [unclassified Phyllobacterium]MCX8280072.1 response regulator [Phyllobacterium sp. 0TCS1.6C]MCX8294366.1 response regulator [Phyllobacterium sp. 0TCS1.6A]